MCAPEEQNDKSSNTKMDFTRGTAAVTASATDDSRSASPISPRPSSPTALLAGKQQPNGPSMPSGLIAAAASSRRAAEYRRQSSSVVEAAVTHGFHLTIGSAISYLTVLFSLYFPFVLAPWAASQTYYNAFWEYQADLNHFDNTAWTYGTDYLLTVCMFVLAQKINYTVIPNLGNNKLGTSYDDDDLAMVGRAQHKWWSRGLLWSYMLSVLAGGLAHQFYTTPDSRNSLSFRILWTCCVGTVTAASGFMGAIGAELVRQDTLIRRLQRKSLARGGQARVSHDNRAKPLPTLPEAFWLGFGVLATGVVIGGGFSFQRPACDIFIAGITQFPSTFYLMYIFTFGLSASMPTVQRWARIVGVIGFILNAPLLPMYPLLVQYTDWTLGTVNTLLHTWLLVAWSMQGIALRHVGQALQVAAEDLNNQYHYAEGDGSSSLLSTTKVDKPKVS